MSSSLERIPVTAHSNWVSVLDVLTRIEQPISVAGKGLWGNKEPFSPYGDLLMYFKHRSTHELRTSSLKLRIVVFQKAEIHG